MKKFDLTFGIPVYNAEKYIGELLDCFKETNKFTYEVIIVDDGSNDSSYSICKKYKNKHFKVYKKENGGVSSARNYIIDKSQGEWITFIDADDLIEFDKYESIFKKIREDKYDYHIGIRNRKKFINRINDISYLIENEIINSPVDKFYKRKIINDNRIIFNNKYSLGEDLLFNLQYLKKVMKCYYYYSNEMYIIRIIDYNSLTHKYREDKFDELMAVNEECKNLYKNNEKILKSLEYIRIKNCISCIKDYFIFDGIYDKTKLKNNIISMKKEHKREYLILNSIKTTIIYNLWYLLCPNLLMYIIKKYTKKKEVFK